jgi:hypothetical protein
MDRVRALKIEHPSSGGTEIDEEPNSLDINEDYLDARGVTLQDDSSDDEDVVLSRDSAGNMTFADQNTTTKTLAELASGSGMTEEQHRTLDQLTHELDEDHYTEYAYSGFKIQSVIEWTDSSKTTKIREYQYTYTGNKITQEVAIQYDASGVEKERLTYVYSYSGWRVSNITTTRT